jgi:hypothetical protein
LYRKCGSLDVSQPYGPQGGLLQGYLSPTAGAERLPYSVVETYNICRIEFFVTGRGNREGREAVYEFVAMYSDILTAP